MHIIEQSMNVLSLISKIIFFLLFLLSIIKLIKKEQIEISFLIEIIKWILICIAFVAIVKYAFAYFSEQTLNEVFFNRLYNGISYPIMILGNTLFPLSLLYKPIGRNLYFLLLISLMMNIGWLFELLIIILTLNNSYMS